MNKSPEADILSLLMVSPFGPLGRGGIHTWTETTVGCLLERSDVRVHQVNTAVVWRHQTDLRPLKRYAGGAAQAVRDISRVSKMMRKEKIDVMHLNTSAGPNIIRDIMMLRIARRHNVGSVIHYHFGRIPELQQANGRHWKLIQQAGHDADVSLLMDQASVKTLTAALPSDIVRYMANPIGAADLDEFAKQPIRTATPDHIEIACIGHVLVRKGCSELTQACENLANERVHLKFVGPVDEAYQASLQAMAPKLQSTARLTFIGGLDRASAMQHMAGTDILCLPSYGEGFPSIILEAMAIQKPIVASTVGAMPDMLGYGTDNECGVIVEPKDVKSLEAGLRKVMENPELMATYVARARKKLLDLYDAPVVNRQMVALWKEVKSMHAKREAVSS